MWTIAILFLTLMAGEPMKTAAEPPLVLPIGTGRWYVQSEADEWSKQEWVGLFEEKGDWRLARVRLVPGEKVILVTDEPGCVLETDPKGAGWVVPAGLLKPGSVARSASTIPSLPYEARSADISVGPRSYTLHVEGFFGNDAKRHRVTLREGDREQALFDESWIDEGHVSIAWAGDLDRDGRLDLITDMTPKYSMSVLTLWLSSKAGDGELVGIAARSVHYGC